MNNNEIGKELLEAFQKIVKLSRQNNNIIDGLNVAELKLCGYINERALENKETTPIELSSKFQITPPGINKLLNSLERKKLINRYRKENNRKQVYIELSEQTSMFVQKEREKLLKYISEVVDKMGEIEIKQLIKLINKLNSTMEIINKGESSCYN